MTNREEDDPRNREPLDLSIRAEDEEDRPRKRHPGDFDYWPSDEQMAYFVRGGR